MKKNSTWIYEKEFIILCKKYSNVLNQLARWFVVSNVFLRFASLLNIRGTQREYSSKPLKHSIVEFL